MSLNGYLSLFHVRLSFRASTFNILPCSSKPTITSFWQYKLLVDIRRAFLEKLSSNWSGVVEIDEFAVFPLLYLRNLQK